MAQKGKFLTGLIFIVVSFVVFCGFLIAETGLFEAAQPAGRPCILLQQTTVGENIDAAGVDVPNKENTQLEAVDFPAFGADHAPAESITLGSVNPDSGFKFQLELSSKGAAIEKATFSEFDDRYYKDPQPLVILTPVSGSALSMANKGFVFVDRKLQLPLDKLHWKTFGVEKDYDSSQTVSFEAIIKDKAGKAVLKLNKTYKVAVDSYHLDCDLNIENLSASEQKVRFDLAGPVGIGREAGRADMRKTVAGFRNPQGQIISARLDTKKLRKAKTIDDRRLMKPGATFLWAAVVNKYFAAILVPMPDKGKDYSDWVTDKAGRFYNPDGDIQADTGDETIGVDLKIASNTLAPVGQAGSSRTYNFLLYLGPKDKSLFDENELYRKLGFIETIDFLSCCCPASIISPLAFGILAIMKWMYGFIGNYGVVIIILVFLIRLALHPLTKKSQVSMSKMSKLAPRAEEIKKK